MRAWAIITTATTCITAASGDIVYQNSLKQGDPGGWSAFGSAASWTPDGLELAPDAQAARSVFQNGSAWEVSVDVFSQPDGLWGIGLGADWQPDQAFNGFALLMSPLDDSGLGYTLGSFLNGNPIDVTYIAAPALGGEHSLRFSFDADSVTVLINGVDELALESSAIVGDELVFSSWGAAGSTFSDVEVARVAEPGTVALFATIAGLSLLLARSRAG